MNVEGLTRENVASHLQVQIITTPLVNKIQTSLLLKYLIAAFLQIRLI